jgi:hypothetical protein
VCCSSIHKRFYLYAAALPDQNSSKIFCTVCVLHFCSSKQLAQAGKLLQMLGSSRAEQAATLLAEAVSSLSISHGDAHPVVQAVQRMCTGMVA